MRRFLLFFFVLQFVLCACPDGYELVKEGECRGFASKLSSTYEESLEGAVAKCDQVQGKPVIIHNEEQQQYWLQKRESWRSDYLILGLRCNASGKAEWADGSVIDFIPPDGGVDDMNYCYSDCSWYLWHDGHYHSLCTKIAVDADVFCTTQLHQPVASGDGCELIDDDDKNGACYQVSTAAENWEDAQKICKTLGADLASVHSAQENSFIRRLAMSHGALKGVFLGGKSTGKDNGFGWTDGSPWDYNSFATGYPAAGKGDCVVMDTSTSAGQWQNQDCSASLPVACARQSSNHVCAKGPWTEGEFITSPGFPFDSSTPCDFEFTVAAGKRVEVEVIFLEANSCCDQLVMSDSLTGGNLVAKSVSLAEEWNVTGEVNNKVYKTKSSNTMKVSWKPNGGVNVKGVMMTYRAI
ncbi:hypothetical protein PMAYCL1PPCAC_22354 [Pristionchus mayeri]|uniref:C-type lectin domain-containing protein n=1 Tax=Pristionchus mayeri TaxID=1317129 RepID=A0AAN5CWZ5_9BILA|nr:hypothetical protein PMAYCL1PPCAC_22354 [Pristionchus mayeri]